MNDCEVETCDDCPMFHEDCGAACGLNWRDIERQQPPPDWCPLRQGPVTIRLTVKT